VLLHFGGQDARPTKAKGKILSRTKVHLPFLEINLQDGDAQAGAGLVDFS
jgi:hypothetical protein